MPKPMELGSAVPPGRCRPSPGLRVRGAAERSGTQGYAKAYRGAGRDQEAAEGGGGGGDTAGVVLTAIPPDHQSRPRRRRPRVGRHLGQFIPCVACPVRPSSGRAEGIGDLEIACGVHGRPSNWGFPLDTSSWRGVASRWVFSARPFPRRDIAPTLETVEASLFPLC